MSVVEFPAALARARFGRLPFGVTHQLAGHPAFSVARLIDLARRMPVADVEWNSGGLPIGSDPAQTPLNGLSPEETIRRVETCGSWLVLKFVERDPVYAALLDQCLHAVAAVTEQVEPGMHRRHAFLFVSSPGATTPYHFDPEQNFLLQIRGTKTISVWDPSDRVALPEAEIERSLTGGHRNLPWLESFAERATSFNIEPGAGVHIPFAAPHWVRNGPRASVSLSVTFRTRATVAREGTVKVNAFLRRLGLSPSPLGRSPARDAVKTTSFAVARRMARLVRYQKR